jgi:hypothetical protein
MRKKISLRVIRRILFYYEALLKLNLPETMYISSKKLEEVTGVSCNQVRQDFFYLGISIGKQKKGYLVKKLFRELKKILSIDHGARVIIIGAGRIGQALSNYKLFKDHNITVKALFDIKPELVGTEVGKLGQKKPARGPAGVLPEGEPRHPHRPADGPGRGGPGDDGQADRSWRQGSGQFRPQDPEGAQGSAGSATDQRLHRHLAVQDRLPVVQQEMIPMNHRRPAFPREPRP